MSATEREASRLASCHNGRLAFQSHKKDDVRRFSPVTVYKDQQGHTGMFNQFHTERFDVISLKWLSVGVMDRAAPVHMETFST